MHEHFVGTKPVDERMRFDVGRLEDYMRERIEGFSGPLEVEQFSGGQSNPTFMLKAGDKRFVLRRKPPGKLLPSAHAVDREFRVISALYPTEVPVARAFFLCEDDSVIGTSRTITSSCVLARVATMTTEPVLPTPPVTV